MTDGLDHERIVVFPSMSLMKCDGPLDGLSICDLFEHDRPLCMMQLCPASCKDLKWFPPCAIKRGPETFAMNR